MDTLNRDYTKLTTLVSPNTLAERSEALDGARSAEASNYVIMKMPQGKGDVSIS